MRFGVREICDVVFRPLTSVDIGNQHFDAGQPVLYLDTAKTSTLEGAATTVYAQGGRGNPRLIGWDGEKTLTFTLEDSLISATSFAMLSGAGVVEAGGEKDNKIYTHQIYDLVVENQKINNQDSKVAKLPKEISEGATLVISKEAPVYATILDSAGAPNLFLSAITDKEIYYTELGTNDQGNTTTTSLKPLSELSSFDGTLGTQSRDIYFKIEAGDVKYPDGSKDSQVHYGDTVRIDCYTVHNSGVKELQIKADTFAGYYYIEADTLFREESTGRDLPAQFVIPRGKIQSNFTFTMANSGDPSTFTFTIDAFPAFTKFNKRDKVMAVLQIVDEAEENTHNYADTSIYGHSENYHRDDIYGNYTGTTTASDGTTPLPYNHSIFDAESSNTSNP